MKIEDGMTPEQRIEQERLEIAARKLATLLERVMNPSGVRTTGFAVLMFAFGEPPQPATWISNADRGDMIRAVEEWLKRAKART